MPETEKIYDEFIHWLNQGWCDLPPSDSLMPLITASHQAKAERWSLKPRVSHHMPANSPQSATLHSGPAAAIFSSLPGCSASRPMRAMPPKMNRVMLFTGMPLRMLTRLWESS